MIKIILTFVLLVTSLKAFAADHALKSKPVLNLSAAKVMADACEADQIKSGYNPVNIAIVDTGNDLIKPKLPTGRSEFDEFQWWKPAELLHAWLSHKVKLPPPQVTLIRDIVELGFSELGKNPPSGYHRIEYANGVELVPIPTDTLPPATHTDCYVLGHPGGSRIIVDPAARSIEALEILSKKVAEIELSLIHI